MNTPRTEKRPRAIIPTSWFSICNYREAVYITLYVTFARTPKKNKRKKKKKNNSCTAIKSALSVFFWQENGRKKKPNIYTDTNIHVQLGCVYACLFRFYLKQLLRTCTSVRILYINSLPFFETFLWQQRTGNPLTRGAVAMETRLSNPECQRLPQMCWLFTEKSPRSTKNRVPTTPSIER